MSIFEAIMLICFGLSWPISITKAVRTKIVSGKSPLFMMVICFGYICGIIHKVTCAMDWVIILYAFNMMLVIVDIILYYKYLPEKRSVVV